MKTVVPLARLIVGVLFIVSGLIKLNDPVGFSFKLEEYFSKGVLDLPYLEPYALVIALLLVIIEVVLGVMLLVGLLRRVTVYSLLVMILFFTFLTFYSAYFNKVTDCGCFGDAVKLTPWQSFGKDVFLLILIGILVAGLRYIRPIFTYKFRIYFTGICLVCCLLFANKVLNHLPSKDFRPYKIGNNIQAGMIIPEGAPKAIYEYAWKFNVNGDEKVVVTDGDYPSVNGKFIDVETTLVQEGYEPPIHDFTIEKNGTDFAAAFLQEEKLMLVIAYDLLKTDYDAFEALKDVTDHAFLKDYKIVGMSASGDDVAKTIKKTHQLNFDFYFTDETTLKTIVRSNPGVLILERGTILQKVHYNDLDELEY